MTLVGHDRVVGAGTPEEVRFLEVASETGGARTLVEVCLQPGAGNPLHVHDTFAETFEVLDGTLTVELDGEVLELGGGETARVDVGHRHRFANDTAETVCFRCALEPAHRGFEEALQIGDGLGRDGRAGKAGFPKDPRHLALLLERSGSRFVGGPPRLLGPAFRALAWLGRRSGEDRRLVERYVRF